MAAATKLFTHVSGAHTTIRSGIAGASDTLANPDLFVTLAVAAMGLLLTLALARRSYPAGTVELIQPGLLPHASTRAGGTAGDQRSPDVRKPRTVRPVSRVARGAPRFEAGSTAPAPAVRCWPPGSGPIHQRRQQMS
jgi:hypothetical protein